MDVLQIEIDTLNARRDDLLAEHRGQYVVIAGARVVGFFENPDEAFEAGLDACGPSAPFLLHHLQEQAPVEMPAVVHGLMNAELP